MKTDSHNQQSELKNYVKINDEHIDETKEIGNTIQFEHIPLKSNSDKSSDEEKENSLTESKEIEDKETEECEIVKDALFFFINNKVNQGLDYHRLIQDSSRKTWLKIIKFYVFSEENDENNKNFINFLSRYKKDGSIDISKQSDELRRFLREELTHNRLSNSLNIKNQEEKVIQQDERKPFNMNHQTFNSRCHMFRGDPIKRIKFCFIKFFATFIMFYFLIRSILGLLNSYFNFEKRILEAYSPEFELLKNITYEETVRRYSTETVYLTTSKPPKIDVQIPFWNREAFYFLSAFLVSILHSLIMRLVFILTFKCLFKRKIN